MLEFNTHRHTKIIEALGWIWKWLLFFFLFHVVVVCRSGNGTSRAFALNSIFFWGGGGRHQNPLFSLSVWGTRDRKGGSNNTRRRLGYDF